MIDKTYIPSSIESDIYTAWETSGAFSVKLDARPNYTIMMPPPNVTGSLHIGHALGSTLQDILVRFHRMKGFDVLWQPGTDHAGIATQSVVERQMDQEGLTRHDLGREGFIKRVWTWKEHSGGTIIKQLRRLGASADWSRERFTMDAGLSEAVIKVFVQLYREGLIYRAKRLVNWDPQLLTAVSDLEVNNIETAGKMYTLRYPIAGAPGTFLDVATTRPETLFGDTAVAVNPTDTRWAHLIGQQVYLPLCDRLIPVVGDDYCDPGKGTGAVKITPAHDFNDFEVGRRHGLESRNILQPDGRLDTSVPEAYQGLDRAGARAKVLQDLDDQDLLGPIHEISHTVPHSDRSGAIIEPYLTDQWFVNAHVLAQPALEAVKTGKTRFIPQNWENTYFEWLNNIQPWCISRQLWWGHRIPAWFGPDNEIFVAPDAAQAQVLAQAHYGAPVVLTQDPDVLDTWFSSALWPFSTLGWPEETPALAQCYPGDVLVTGHDIIFFWVARMMMMGLHFTGKVPFKDVCITALVRDEKGQKMSKSKGNVVDPLAFVDQYGADALRFALASLAGPGRDINFSASQVEGYRNFATKIWNAFRFCQHNTCILDPGFDPTTVIHPINQWIIAEIATLTQNVNQSLTDYRFDEACSHLYQFVWGRFCDWYIEFTKSLIQEGTPDQQSETRATTAWAFGQILHLLHPFMPFLSEKLWQALAPDHGLLITAPWPPASAPASPPAVASEVEWLIQFVTQLRLARQQLNLPPGKMLRVSYVSLCMRAQSVIGHYGPILMRIARLETLETGLSCANSAQVIHAGDVFFIDLAGLIDLDAERKRLQGALESTAKDILQLQGKLANEEFLAKAPPAVIDKNQQALSQAQTQHHELQMAYDRLQITL